MIKNIYQKKHTANIFNDERLNTFLLISGTRQGCPLSPLLFNMVLEVLNNVIEKKKKDMQIGKEEIKLPLFISDMVSSENPKESTYN